MVWYDGCIKETKGRYLYHEEINYINAARVGGNIINNGICVTGLVGR